jgi:hypothetical protein
MASAFPSRGVGDPAARLAVRDLGMGALGPGGEVGSGIAVAVGPIHFCNLDCGDEVLAARLRARPAWRAWSEERIVEHQRFAAHLRASVRPTFDTGVLDADEVADRIARWIQRLLAAVDR